MPHNSSWEKIFAYNNILNHDFLKEPYHLSSGQIKKAVQDFEKTGEKEVRILCKMDSREDLPDIMRGNGLILLPVKNGEYVIVKAEGYLDIPEITIGTEDYISKLDFSLETSTIGNSEMQHLDFAYASSLIRTFIEDPTLVLTIRGRKYTPEFKFSINNHNILVKSVQTEVDAGYEGKDKVVLVEAKNSKTKNTVIRQLYYPYRQWSEFTNKDVILLFFEKIKGEYLIWQYTFTNKYDYNSIKLVKAKRYKII